MKWAEELKKEYSKIAKENQGNRNDLTFGQDCPEVETSKKISEDLDMGQTTLKKAQYIYNNAPEDMIKDLDDGQLSINKAYITLKEQLQTEKEKARELERQLKLK